MKKILFVILAFAAPFCFSGNEEFNFSEIRNTSWIINDFENDVSIALNIHDEGGTLFINYLGGLEMLFATTSFYEPPFSEYNETNIKMVSFYRGHLNKFDLFLIDEKCIKVPDLRERARKLGKDYSAICFNRVQE